MKTVLPRFQAMGLCLLILFPVCWLTSPIYVHDTKVEVVIEDESVVSEPIPIAPPVNTMGIKIQITKPVPVKEEASVLEEPLPEQEAQPWRTDVPLSVEIQNAILAACEETGVDPLLALGLIDTESGFQVDIVSPTGDYGLCQLNYRYFDPTMTPEENVTAGIGLLASNIARYGSVAAGLTAYNRGHDDGTRFYANTVLAKAQAWGYSGD